MGLCYCSRQPRLCRTRPCNYGHEHPSLFHAFTLETDAGRSNQGGVAAWDLDGWIGSDENKLWLKSEGERVSGVLESAEVQALYGRNISAFWDAQIGLRQDFYRQSLGWENTSYIVAGVNGLAPYYFETDAHLFVSDQGDVSARLRQENDVRLLQELILQPYAEANLYAQDVPEQAVGAGLATLQGGLQLRYEITRQFAPYVDVNYTRKFGETASLAHQAGESRGEAVAMLGLRLRF